LKIEGQHRFQSSRPDVWRALQDPQVLANSLPGVRRLEVDGPDRYGVTVTVGVGAVKGAYDGTFELTDKRDLESCRVSAQATGAPGSVSATAAMTLADDGGGTLLIYDADAKVTGPLAGVGQRMVASAAKKTTREFLEAIDRELTAPAAAPAPTAEPQAAAAPDSVAADGAAAAPALGAPPAGVYLPSSPAGGGGGERDLKLFTGGLVAGFVLGVVGVLIGRRTAR
jgi:hypothetical protein